MHASGRNLRISPAKLALAVSRLREENENLDLVGSDPIAIIGMGCRFPGGANSPAEFWSALKEGRDAIGEVPEGRWEDSESLPLQICRGGYLPDIERFDAAYFGISPREAQQMDPQQRLLLEVTWEALWDAGIEPATLTGTNAGVFAAIYNNDYARLHFRDNSLLTAHAGIGTAHSVAAGRLSFLLNLKGPSLAIDSACSSSLVATHLACQSLRSRECGLAIVGASSLKLLSDEVIVFSKWGMLAHDGRCKTFDAGADGFVPGEGSGAIILKRLSDALLDGDRVRAVIRGTAVNHDGRTTVLTAPNGPAQEAVLKAALKNALLEPDDISYIETHGTGTSLGDPIEIEAISAVYGQSGSSVSSAPCLLGAVKTNLGHLEAAAGIAGLIKAVLCLERGEIPGNLHFRKLNPEISLDGTRLTIAVENTAWARSEKPRAAGISSFGLGGTNGHVIVEEAPLIPAQNSGSPGRTIPLPAYAWKRERFWLAEVADSKTSAMKNSALSVTRENNVHPLLGRTIESAFVNGTLFESHISTATTPYLTDHSLGDRVIVPFAALLEIAAAAIRAANKVGQTAIRDFVICEPLFLSSAGCKLQVLVKEHSFEIASSTGPGWKVNAKGTLQMGNSEATAIDLAALRARCKKEIDSADMYRSLESAGLRYRAAFRSVESLWSGQDETLAFLRLSDERHRHDAGAYGIHPALLDGCLQTVVVARGESSDDLFLPIGVDRFELLKNGATELWVNTRMVTSSKEAFSADIVVMDAAGEVVARLTGFHAKRTSAALFTQTDLSAAPTYELAWRSTPLEPTGRRSRAGERWLFIENHDQMCSLVTRSLEQRGAICKVAANGQAALHALQKDSWSGIVYDARSIGDSVEECASNSAWSHQEKDAVEFVLAFAKFLKVSSSAPAPRLWIVSRSAVSIFPTEDVSISQAPLWGLIRSLILEHPEASSVLIDVDRGHGPTDAQQILINELDCEDSESIVAFRSGSRYTPRLIHWTARDRAAQRLKIDLSGRLEDLRLEKTARTNPATHQVEVRVRASGLNFRDVLTALGMFPARTTVPGAECAGTIERVGAEVRDWKVGEHVLAFAPGSLQTFVNIPADFLAKKPDAMTFADAAGIPVAFLTAYYAFHRLAKISAKQRVLIHAAAGGVGLAAVQLATRAGAQIFATAGSEKKREFLKGLGIEHVFDSRSLSFRDEVLKATDGAGVDIVLNSLAGEFIRASLDVVAERGCFLEIGKRDIWTDGHVAALGKQIRYFPFDLGEVAMEDSKLVATMLNELMAMFSRGELHTLPTALYPLEESAHAFRTMAQARHIGKIVMECGESEAGESLRDLISNGTVLITGGLGALGTELALWLADQGARNIVLASRTASDSAENSSVAKLRSRGVDVSVECVDIASEEQLRNALNRIRADRPPLRAVFHVAGVLHDAVLANESWNSYGDVTAPKIEGAWNLHRLTQSDAIRQMVFFSSAASLLGSPGQGSYAAGNAFLDALAHYRSSRGLATLSVNWGAWASAGMAARMAPEQTMRLSRQGVRPMQPLAALAALKEAIEAGRTQIAVLDMDWEQFLSANSARRDIRIFGELRPQQARAETEAAREQIFLETFRWAPESDRKFLLSSHVKACARRVLGLQEAAAIPDDVALQDLGLDSLMALEMRNELSQSVGLTLAAGLLFDYPSVEELTRHLIGLLIDSTRPVLGPAVHGDNTTAAFESFSDEEAELLLIDELDRAGREKASA